MPDPFKLACHCGFEAETPEAFLDHAMATGHIELPVGEEDGSIAEFLGALATIQQFAEAERDGTSITLPEGTEINQLSVEDILTDDTLSDEDKQKILARFAAFEKQKES